MTEQIIATIIFIMVAIWYYTIYKPLQKQEKKVEIDGLKLREKAYKHLARTKEVAK